MFGESTSESPRLPSPWDSRLLTPTGSKTPQANHATSHQQHQSLIPEEDLSGHIEYKLRLPAHPSVDRLARLTSQLKWRLLEGGGEAIYELGVCDNGLLLGIDIDEIRYSLATLERMADGLGASVQVVRRMEVSGEGVKELPLDDAPSIPWPRSIKEEPPIPPQSTATVPPDPKSEPDLPTASMLPPYFIHKRRLTKKDRRQAKRDRDLWLQACEKQQQASLNTHAEVEDDIGFLTFEDDDGKVTEQASSSTASSTSTPAYISVTPPVDEIPQLSHSPSPPSSTSGSQHCAIQRNTFTKVEMVDHTHTSITTSSCTKLVCDPLSSTVMPSRSIQLEYSEAEQAQYALRRHLRKQWKREKQHAKQMERARQMAGSLSSRHHSSPHGMHYNFSMNDKYLDGLVVLFDNAVLTAETADEIASRTALADSHAVSERREAKSEPSKHRRRHRRRGPAFSPTSTPLSGNLPPATAIEIASAPADVTRTCKPPPRNWNSRRHPPPVAKSPNGPPRYAMECIIKMPSASASRVDSEDDNEAELALFGSEDFENDNVTEVEAPVSLAFPSRPAESKPLASLKIEKRARKASRPGSERTRLQSFIDFETVWDELEMDL
ncbi:hypothetical protein P389DRAFT_211373 [Cystobasidium minutum MCA 4210]|uniref:uncharacterized protein n=1 Tax=Cystobasidium minutum MCA 4210 TaxID=1397322 RepID=UPI0034CEC633|eukprot:jgi/Rhomi1/211373/estExt_Genemark1.C_4_t30048